MKGKDSHCPNMKKNAQSHNELPSGWVWTKLKDVALINYRDPGIVDLPEELQVSFVPMASVDAEKGIIARPDSRTLSEVKRGYTPFSNGDVIFAKITPSMENGKAAIARDLINGRGFGSTEFHVLTPKDGVLVEWLFYFVRQEKFRQDAKAKFAGTAGQLRVPKSFLENYDVPLAPFREQKRVVEKIEELITQLDVASADLKRVQANLARYRASLLKAACEGRLVPTEAELARAEGRNYESGEELLQRILAERKKKWEEGQKAKGKELSKRKYKEPDPLNTDGLPKLPEGWVWANMEQVTEHRLGKMLDKEKNKGEPRPYLRNINVRWFSFDLSDIQLMRVTDQELDDVTVREGDLVVCEGGEPGRAAVWQKKGEPIVIQKALHRVRPARGILPWYLAYKLAADASSGVLEKYFTGSTIKHFTGEALSSYVFSLPPTAEQDRIVAEVDRRISVIQELEAALNANLMRAERMRQAILKRAFEGRLVPQDAEDEPASVLLQETKSNIDEGKQLEMFSQ